MKILTSQGCILYNIRMRKYITILLITLFLVTPVLAHSWYPIDCCSGQDCIQIPCEELIETAKGYTYQAHEFTKDMIRVPKGPGCHVCIHPILGPRCVFPEMGS